MVDLAKECEVPDVVFKWLLTQVGGSKQYLTAEDIATIASTEALVDTNIIEEAKADGLLDALKPMGARAGIRKFWSRCSGMWNEEKAAKAALSSAAASAIAIAATPVPEPPQVEEGIPTKDFELIVKAWWDHHHFVLPDAQLLIPAQQKQMWKEWGMKPPQVSDWDARNLRQKSNSGRPKLPMIPLATGRPLEAEQHIVDAIDRSFELWVRCRAYLMTLSYVSILTPDWFPYQSAVEVADYLLRLMMDLYGGRSPDIHTMVGAWAATSAYWSEMVRIQKRSPAEVFTNMGMWSHKWSWNQADIVSVATGSRPAPPRTEADNSDLKARLDQVTGQVRRLQSSADQSSGSRRNGNDDRWADIREPPLKKGKGKGGNGGGGMGAGKGGGGQNGYGGNGGNGGKQGGGGDRRGNHDNKARRPRR